MVDYALQQFDFPSDQPLPRRLDQLNIRVLRVDNPERPRDQLFLAVRVDLRVAQDSQPPPQMVYKCLRASKM